MCLHDIIQDKLNAYVTSRAETNIKFYNLNIFQINERINELFFKNFLNK